MTSPLTDLLVEGDFSPREGVPDGGRVEVERAVVLPPEELAAAVAEQLVQAHLGGGGKGEGILFKGERELQKEIGIQGRLDIEIVRKIESEIVDYWQ